MGKVGSTKSDSMFRTSSLSLRTCFVLYPCYFVLLLLACSQPGEKVSVLIPAGLSTNAIAETLHQHQVIDNPAKFRFLARVFGLDKKLKYGHYEFPQNAEEALVLCAMSMPGNGTVRVTIPEGYTMKQIAGLLEAHAICPADDFLSACRDKTLLNSLGVLSTTAEGYLFPETYDFEINSNPASVIARMTRQFFSVYDELAAGAKLQDKPQRHREKVGSGLLEIGNWKLEIPQVVILASIVEREAVLAGEAPLIAGVFLNRLKRGMPLQSCATVEYILPEHKEKLTLEDTKLASPYNTYLHPGLPPGPICNPGRTGLAAALNPARTDYLYFLSKGDGSHLFSRTWHEHAQAQRRLRYTNN